MSRALRRILFTVGGAAGLLILVAFVAPLFVNVNRYKPQLEAAASEALGMEVRVGGRVGMGFFPGFHLTLEGARILGEQGAIVASARRATLYIELVPLLRKEFRLHRIDLRQPKLSVERNPAGTFNVERLKKAVALLETLDGGSVTLTNGTLLYADQRSGGRLEATGIDLGVRRIRLAGGRGLQVLKGLSLRAKLTCAEIRSRTLSGSALKVVVEGNEGVLECKPATMSVFGGQGEASVRADLTGTVPRCQIHCSLPSFRIEEFLKVLSPNKAVEGEMSFSMNLSMQGERWTQLVQTAAGEASLRGRDLTLLGNDLDGVISRFDSSQNFNLVDVGAVFLAGPLGLAVTKGYNFAGLFQGTGGTTKIGTVVSDWKVEHGVARAKDVAMATAENRLALQGGLDFVNGRFADMSVAVVDAEGCPRLQQTIRGPFEKPEVEKPHVFTSLAGPVVKLFKKARNIFPAGPCEVFYSGSVAPPR
jgi:uncharacterized protein involved in outer membrane biogenesis